MMASYPPTIDDAERQRLEQVVKDWTMANGLAVRPPVPVTSAVASTEAALAPTLAMPVPVTIFPSAFPKPCFEEAQSLSSAYNKLYMNIANDEEFLGQIVAEVTAGDEFTSKLWAVHQRVKKDGYVQKHSLGIFRSDYLVHQETAADGKPHLQIKQVEFNTISASFGGLSEKTSKLHKFLAATEYPLLRTPQAAYDLPPNESSRELGASIQDAFAVYGRTEPSTNGFPRCVVVLTQDGERNVFDQRHIEYAVDAPVFRVPFSEALQQTTVADSPKRELLYHHLGRSTFEVAVVYMRCGYDPSDYPTEAAWETRYQIERSNAIKCPTVLTQVAGCKKVQQVLATPFAPSHNDTKDPKDTNEKSVLTRFVDANDEAGLRRTFTNIFPLDRSPSGQAARTLALDPVACRKFVLKPQREGGGNNYYRDKIPAHLATVPEEHWASYILMELIEPPPVSNLILRNGQVEQGGVICELGIFSTCIWTGKDSLRNKSAGYLLRTKGDQSEEGGVAAGFGSMDSVNLV